MADQTRPVAKVGKAEISAEELSRALAALPSFQRAALAKRGDVRRHVLEEAIVRPLLYAQDAEALRLAENAAVKLAREEVLVELLLDQLEAEALEKRPISEDDVKAYHQKHAKDFETPRAIRLWRILTKTREDAEKALALARGQNGLQAWRDFARERSVDRATSMRGGDIGFVHPDGNTDVPRVRVPPSLFEAASQLKEGEPAKEPVPEGEHFAALWRRGSLPDRSRSWQEAEPEIRALLRHERRATARTSLLDRLRQTHVSDLHPELLEGVQLPELDVAPFASKQPATAAPAAASLSSTPQGLR